MIESNIRINHKDVTISFNEETEKWHFEMDDEEYVSDTLKEARSSINKIFAQEKKSTTPFECILMNEGSYRSPKVFEVVQVTNYSKNERVYIKAVDDKQVGLPQFVQISGWQSSKLFELDSGVKDIYNKRVLAQKKVDEAEAEVRSFDEQIEKLALRKDEILLKLLPKLKMKELQK